jgi:Zn-dependent protease with chaperone function
LRSLIRFGLSVWALSAPAQYLPGTASLWIRIDEAGRQEGLLMLPGAESGRIGPTLAKALGCRPEDLTAGRLEVKCAAPASRHGLTSTIHWPLSILRDDLLANGAASLNIHISHSPNGNARTTPALETTRGFFGWSHHGALPVTGPLDVELESGFEKRQAWLAGCGAVGVVLAPLVLAALGGGIVTLLAGVRVIAVLTGTVWLWIVFSTDAPALAALAASGLPGPAVVWAIAAVALPMLSSVCLGCLILRPLYRKELPRERARLRQRLTLWGGISAASFLVTVVGLFQGADSLIPWAAVGLTGFIGGTWQRFRTVRGRVDTLEEGGLVASIHQLAAKAGTRVTAVHLIRGGSDAAAAFASRSQAILLSQALIRDLSRDEVDSVVAHELSHIRRRHVLWISAAISILPLACVAQIFAPGLLSWAPLTAPPGFLLFMAMRRRQERTADADAARWAGGPEPLIRALARASLGNGAPLDWRGWVRFALPHPPTMERFRLLAASAALPSGRIEELLAAAKDPPRDRYELPAPAIPSNAVFGPGRRARLQQMLGALAILFPPAYSVAVVLPAAPLTFAPVELACGMLLFYLVYEWILLRSRAGVRRELADRLAAQGVGTPGEFVGFTPSTDLRIYNGMYDLEWGFVAFESGWLVFRGDQGAFSVSCAAVTKLWLHPGPANWTPKPMVSFELAGGRCFSMRPFDRAFGPSAAKAAARLFGAAAAWRGADPGQPPPLAATPLSEYPNPESLPNTKYPWTSLVKGWLRISFYVFGAAGFIQISLWRDWNPSVLLTALLVAWGMQVFAAWPALRR